MTTLSDIVLDPRELARSFATGLLDALRPRLTVSEWADKFRILSKVSSAEHGRWSTRRTPYLREIMDLLSDEDPTQEIVFQKPTQIGGTECGNNWIGEHVHQGVGTMMIVMPTSSGAKKSSKTRITPMINDTPELRGRIRDAKSRDSGNTTLMKEFGNGAGLLVFAGANSANDLKSTPSGKLFLDEIEEYPDDVDGQGDPEELAAKRADTYTRKKMFKVSTPTIADGRIDRAYKASDRREYYVPCPHCRHYQTLRFDRLKWTTRKVYESVNQETGELTESDTPIDGASLRDSGEILDIWYDCEACSDPIHEHSKSQMLLDGAWRATNPGPDRAAGFKLNALYSPIGWFGWRKIILQFLKAEKDVTGKLKKTFTNTVLGEAYEEQGETVDDAALKTRVESYRINSKIPAGVCVLCAGVDVQGDRLEARLWGYGRNRETWLCGREVIFGPPELPATWAELERLLEKTYDHALGGELRLLAMGVDASDGKTTHFVRMFARKWAPTKRVFALKGQSQAAKPLIGRPTDQDVSFGGKFIKGGVKLWPMGSDTGKAAFYAQLRIDKPGPGYVHLPAGLPDEEFKQMTAERMRTRYIRGHAKVEWVLPSGRRNEGLDCRVMSDAVAEACGVHRMNMDRIEKHLTQPNGELAFESPEAETPGEDDAVPEPRKPARRFTSPPKRGNFSQSWRK